MEEHERPANGLLDGAWWKPWLAGLIVASALCSSHHLVFVFRATWQSRYPVLAQQWANNGPFTALGFFGTDGVTDELAYAARVKDASLHLPAYDPYIRESRSIRQWAIDGLTYAVMGAFQALVGDINATWLLLRFLCCMIWFVLIYKLARHMRQPPPLGIFLAVLIVCYSHLFQGAFLHAFRMHDTWTRTLLDNAWRLVNHGRTDILRLPRPLFSYACLFLASLAAIKAGEKRTWGWSAASGCLGGALAYIRLDVWSSFILTSCAFAAVCSARDRRIRWDLAAAAGLTAVLSLPYLYLNFPPDPDLMLRSVEVYGRHFDPYSPCFALLFLLGLRYGRGPGQCFCACMAASTFVMLNSSLVTGFGLQLFHWRIFGNIFALLLLASFLPERLANRQRLWLPLAAALLFAAFMQGVGYAAARYPFHGLPQDYHDALQWLDSHTRRDDVVLSLNPEVVMLVPVFTRDKVFLSFTMPAVSTYPPFQNCRRLAQAMRILGVDPRRFSRECVFRDKRLDWAAQMATGLRRGEIEKDFVATMLSYSVEPPGERLRGMLEQALAEPMDIEPDYIWFGHLEREYAGRKFGGSRPGWQEVYRNPSVTLYRRMGPGS